MQSWKYVEVILPLKDNSSLKLKASLRVQALKKLTEPPVVLETHGGWGKIYSLCYETVVMSGCVFETDGPKVSALARQRQTWRVYQADCERAIAAGIAEDLAFNFVDVDPYGDPWPVLAGFFSTERARAKRVVITVNDGLPRLVKSTGGWTAGSLSAEVQSVGVTEMRRDYLGAAKRILSTLAAPRGYKITGWAGYYCGTGKSLAHYAAVLDLAS